MKDDGGVLDISFYGKELSKGGSDFNKYTGM